MIEIATVPRDINELNKLKVGQIIRLASQLHLLDNDDNDQAFKTLPPEGKVAAVYNALLEHDARGGPVQPMTAPPQGAIPQQPQYQPPPQAQMTQPQYPQQPPYAPPMAPPPQQMPQQQMQQQPQYPGYSPPVPPAVQQAAQPQYAPQPQYQPPQAPPPQQAYPPPPMQQQPQYQQAPQVQQQAYPPPPPPQQPPVAQRQPQTGSDPSNQGSSVVSALTDVVNQVLAGQGLLGRSLANVGAMVTASSDVNRCLVQILVAMSEQMGMDADDLAKVIKHQDPSTVDKLLTKMGVGVGGGK